jgi:hypothetical protein
MKIGLGVTSIDSITLVTGKVRENAHRAADRYGYRLVADQGTS